jgi:hypothetical protein
MSFGEILVIKIYLIFNYFLCRKNKKGDYIIAYITVKLANFEFRINSILSRPTAIEIIRIFLFY